MASMDDVVEVRPLEGYRLFLRFGDGAAGAVRPGLLRRAARSSQ